FRQNLEETGMGYGLEVEMIRAARELDLLTCPYVFTTDEARAMAEAGADVLVPHMGLTTKGTIGAQTAKTLDQSVELVQAMCAAVSSPADGAERIMTVEATFLPSKSHAFHRHPNQEEVIYVLAGELEQWVEDERRMLRAGDAVVIPAAVVHASYNVGDAPA